jgi:hypothetical protein
MIYKTFKEWKNGNWLEDGEPRKKAYTKDELLLVEMGWKYGYDAGVNSVLELNYGKTHEGFSSIIKKIKEIE